MLRWVVIAFAPWRAPRVLHLAAFWRTHCALAVIPLTAFLHHALFFRPTCMLNPFGPSYLDGTTLKLWLSNDPSLPLALALALLLYLTGLRSELVKQLSLPANLALLPLSLWIWDIPLSYRVVCRLVHDGRVSLAPGIPLQSRHVYLLGLLLYAGLLVPVFRKKGNNN